MKLAVGQISSRSDDARIYRHQTGLVVSDVLSLLSAFVLTVHLRFSALDEHLRLFGIVKTERDPWSAMLPALPVVMIVWLLTLLGCGAYRVEDRPSMLTEFGRIIRALLIMAVVVFALTFFHREVSYSRAFAVMFVAAVLVLTCFARATFRALLRHIRGREDRRRVLLVGASQAATHLAFTSARDIGDRETVIVGVLDDTLAAGTRVAGDICVLGSIRELSHIAKAHQVRSVIITDPKLPDRLQREVFETCLGENLQWSVVPQTLDFLVGRAEPYILAGIPVIGLRRSNIHGANRLFKRAFDILGAAILLFLASPIMVVVAIAIKATSKGPVFFKQQRIGENGQPFWFFKFRSMKVDCDDRIHREYTRRLITEGSAHEEDAAGAVYKIKRDPRLIPIGSFIRRYSIDELPQLLNVIKGDMSLIGPRPPIPYEVEAYRDWHKRRFEAPPGITGLWQVSGRSRLSFEEMVRLDIEYLENWSFTRDVKILWQTMGVVLFDRAY
ncbi:MAG: sugar transferase [Deltaproteobacteria bacterium]|nr:sugar transferase [Deltaproteobacteria bacterium]